MGDGHRKTMLKMAEGTHQTKSGNQKIIQYLFAVQRSLVLVFIYYTIHRDNLISFINQKIELPPVTMPSIIHIDCIFKKKCIQHI